MKNRPARIAASSIRLIALTVWAVTVCFSAALTVPAQDRLPRPPTDRTDPARARFEETSRREIQLRNVGPTAKTSADPKQVAAIAAQVKEDFERILTLHNEMVRAITGNRQLDYGFVSDASAEIKKRASRLQTTLALNKSDADQHAQPKPTPANDAEVKAALILLCRQIESFVKNPIIDSPGTVDAQQLAKARNDLAAIIDIGERIRKVAERLKKAAP